MVLLVPLSAGFLTILYYTVSKWMNIIIVIIITVIIFLFFIQHANEPKVLAAEQRNGLVSFGVGESQAVNRHTA